MHLWDGTFHMEPISRKEKKMKKVQVPIILPFLLIVVIATLTGILGYSSLTSKGDSSDAPKTQQVQSNTEAEINMSGVHGSLTGTKAKLDAMYAVQSTFKKGEYLLGAANELKVVGAYCSSKEENLRQFSAGISRSLENIGQKLSCGGELSEVDSNNLSEIVKAVDKAILTSTKARDENNNDYFRGEFTLPVIEIKSGTGISRENADEAAKTVLDTAEYKEEKDRFYSYGGDNYLLEVSKDDGSVMYRMTGYELQEAELTEEKLKEAADKAKTLLKEKGFGDTVLFQWQAAGGEISMTLYPVQGDAVYMNAPFGVVMSINDGALLGLRTSVFTALNIEDNEKLLGELNNNYKDKNYIVKALNEYGAACYAVSYNMGGSEYISLWQIASSREIKLSKMLNTVHGRILSDIDL